MYMTGNPQLTLSRSVVSGAATANQSVIGIPGGFAPGFTDVFVGGGNLIQGPGTTADYDDSDGMSIKLTVPMAAGTAYRVIVMNPGLMVGSWLPLAGGTLTGPLILAADPTVALGASTKQYVDNKVAGLNIGSYLPLAGGTMTGALNIGTAGATNQLAMSAFPGYYKQISFQSSGNNRFAIGVDSSSESGSNAGSNFFINTYTDAGAYLSTPMTINRAGAAVAINGTLGVSSNASVGGTFSVTGISYHNSDVHITSTGTLSPGLFLQAQGGFNCYLRANVNAGGGGGLDFVNSANTAVNATVSDNGAFTVRGTITAGAGMAVNGGVLNANAGVNSNFVTTPSYNVGTGNVELMYDAGNGVIGFRTGGAYRYFNMDASGNGNALNGTWINGSSGKYKKGVQQLTGALDKVLQLAGVSYQRVDDDRTRLGFIAEDVAKVYPELVYDIQSPAEDVPATIGVALGEFVAPMVEAMRELSLKLDAALQRIAELEAR